MIEMNRISALLHKMNFFARQRRAVKYTHKFVITAKDTKKQGNQQVSNDKDPITNATKVLEGFDPVNNVVDRRLLFEVTGMRLHSDEFRTVNRLSQIKVTNSFPSIMRSWKGSTIKKMMMMIQVKKKT